jgi:hypothetical protein
MSLDFNAIKEIRMVDVCGRYQVALKFRGDYANAPCPLPTHKDGDKAKSFSICLGGNYWRCFSDSCNAKNGGKRGGDVINFVALMENCREKEAAQKLSDWYGVGQEKAAPRMETRPVPKTAHQKTYPENSTSSGSVKAPTESGMKYMAAIDLWLEQLLEPRLDGTDEDLWLRIKKEFKSKLVESYRAGKAAK